RLAEQVFEVRFVADRVDFRLHRLCLFACAETRHEKLIRKIVLKAAWRVAGIPVCWRFKLSRGCDATSRDDQTGYSRRRAPEHRRRLESNRRRLGKISRRER